MNYLKKIELMFEYSVCRRCGNDKIGAGEGSMHVEETRFLRICKCGWFVEVRNGMILNANNERQVQESSYGNRKNSLWKNKTS